MKVKIKTDGKVAVYVQKEPSCGCLQIFLRYDGEIQRAEEENGDDRPRMDSEGKCESIPSSDKKK